MNGVWLEDGSFEAAKGEIKRIKGKGKGKKGKKGKGKGKGKKGKEDDDDEPDAKRMKVEEPEEETNEENFEREWKDRQVCLINLKSAALNGVNGIVKQFMGEEEVIVDGKRKKIKRYMVALEGDKGEKSIKFENLFKVITGSVVKLRGLDTAELNDCIAECGRLDAGTMRYDVTLSDGRHIKAKPANVEYYATYECSQVAGDQETMEWLRSATSLKDKIAAIEECQYPIPLLVPATALVDYQKKCPKSVVIGKSNVANPKGMQALAKEVMSASLIPLGARLVLASLPRAQGGVERSCIGPALAQTRHDDLLRLGKLAGWMIQRCAPRPVFFLLPGLAAKGPTTALAAATCAWPLFVDVCTDIILLDSDRWHKSPWCRLDALLGVWARKPLYVLPEKYTPPVELGNAGGSQGGADENKEKDCPLSFRPQEPFTISRPVEDGSSAPVPLLGDLAKRAEEAEVGMTKVQKPALAIRRLG